MSSPTIDFRTAKKEDLFRAMLRDSVINFGFIPKWDRRAFIKFCKEHGLITKYPNGMDDTVYKAKVRFRYAATVSTVSPPMGGLPGGDLCEWIADIARHRGWITSQKLLYTSIVTFHVHPVARLPEFDYVRCFRDLVCHG